MAVREIDLSKISDKAQQLKQTFSKRIVGQEAATNAFGNVLEKYLSGMYDKTRPICTLLFLGATGTGKTSTVEAFVEGITGSPNNVIRIDCAEFQHSHEIAKLVGSPPGYLGHRETHPIITKERLKAAQIGVEFTVLLFDEIEKASDSLWMLLLGILDKGSLTLGTNEIVDLTSTVIVMTSNVGSREITDAVDGGIGFFSPAVGSVNQTDIKNISVEAAKRKFPSEFLNRIDEIVSFNTLTPEDLVKIFDLELAKIDEMITRSGTVLVIPTPSPAAIKEILREGYDKKYNARNLRRVIERRILSPLSRSISTEQAISGDRLIIDFEDGKWHYYAECVVHGMESLENSQHA